MECWVDLDSGTWGAGDRIVSVYLTQEEAEVFGQLSDRQRISVAAYMTDDNDFEAACKAVGV